MVRDMKEGMYLHREIIWRLGDMDKRRIDLIFKYYFIFAYEKWDMQKMEDKIFEEISPVMSSPSIYARQIASAVWNILRDTRGDIRDENHKFIPEKGGNKWLKRVIQKIRKVF
jgi:hypothetical protein